MSDMYVMSQLGAAEDRNIAVPVAVVDGPTLRVVLGYANRPLRGRRSVIDGVTHEVGGPEDAGREETRYVG